MKVNEGQLKPQKIFAEPGRRKRRPEEPIRKYGKRSCAIRTSCYRICHRKSECCAAVWHKLDGICHSEESAALLGIPNLDKVIRESLVLPLHYEAKARGDGESMALSRVVNQIFPKRFCDGRNGARTIPASTWRLPWLFSIPTRPTPFLTDENDAPFHSRIFSLFAAAAMASLAPAAFTARAEDEKQ